MLRPKRLSPALILGLLAAAVPIAVSLMLAYQQSRQEARDYAATLAAEVLRRGDLTSEQIINSLDELAHAGIADPCSAEGRARMAGIVLDKDYVQAIGVVRDNGLLCSSHALADIRQPLGEPAYISSKGYATRVHVELPAGSGRRFVLSEHSGFVAIINPDLALDMMANEPGIRLGTFARSSGQPLLMRGAFDPSWTSQLNSDAATFITDNDTVAMQVSRVGDFVAYAAVPTSRWAERYHAFVLRLLPIGLVAGLLLGYLISRLIKAQSSIPAQLKLALRRKEFLLHYQPIVDLRSRRIIGAEALIRWRRGEQDVMRPDVFIAAAESAGLIDRITRYVLARVANDMREVFARHPDCHVAINISAQDFESTDLIALIKQTVQAAQCQPGNLILEATEHGFLNAEKVSRRVACLREYGVRVAIDDFGTGYSNLAYLERFAVDFLKIDKSFVDTLGTEAPTSRVVSHIIAMANTLNLEMVAEGVESSAQADELQAQGVQFAQGWHFARPMPVAQLLAALDQQAAEAAT